MPVKNLTKKLLNALDKALAIKKDDNNILMSIARLQFDFSKFEDAEKTVDKVLKADSGNIGANYLKGRLYLAKKDFDNALQRFEVVLKDQPNNPMVHYFKGLCLIGEGKLTLAKGSLLKAVELNPRLIEARLILADFFIRERSKDLAEEQIDSVLKILPENVQALTLLGNLKVLEKDAKGAEEAYKKVIELSPQSAAAYMRLGILYNLTGKLEDAKKNLSKTMELNPQNIEALGLLVGINVKEKNYKNAMDLCAGYKKKIGDNKSLLAGAEYLEGNIYLQQQKLKEARAHFEKSVETDPNMLAPYETLARLSLHDKNYKEAISRYETILKKNPGYLAGYMSIGAIYDQLGNSDKAEEYYRKALDINKNFGAAANNLAWILAEKGQNMDEALEYARTAKEQMPKIPSVMDTLGWVYYLRGNYLSAITELQNCVELIPDNAVVNYHLGMALYKNKKPDAAVEYLDKALKLDPKFKGADAAKKTLEEIKAGS